MDVAIILDNNVSKVQVQPFEVIAESSSDIKFAVFVGKKNKSRTTDINLSKISLNHKIELFRAFLNPALAINRLRENKFPRMDYYYFSMREYLRSFDIVYTQDITRSLYTVASLKRFFNYKIVLRWWENLPYKRLFSDKDAYIAKKSLDKVDIFLPATEMARDVLLLEGIPEEKIVHIYPGIDINRFTPANQSSEYRDRFSIPNDRIVILFVGRLVAHKGLYTLLWAAKLLEKMSLLNNFIFVIVGAGGQRLLMEKMADEMGIRNSFIFTGSVPYDTIPSIYQMSDIFVLPSIMKENIQEQFGLVVAEAMACGKPVVGSAVGGIAEVIGNCGITVPPGDYISLADTLKELASNQELRKELGAKARNRAEKLFSSTKNSMRLLEIFRKLQ